MMPPATFVGEHVYIDLLPYNEPCTGGSLYYLLLIDEYSGYLAYVGLGNKELEMLT